MTSRGRHHNKWVRRDQGTLDEMRFDEEALFIDDEFHNAFQEVDLQVIAKDNYELYVKLRGKNTQNQTFVRKIRNGLF